MLKAYSRLQARINSLRTEEEGATAVEYGLIVALIAAVIVGARRYARRPDRRLLPGRQRRVAGAAG